MKRVPDRKFWGNMIIIVIVCAIYLITKEDIPINMANLFEKIIYVLTFGNLGSKAVNMFEKRNDGNSK